MIRSVRSQPAPTSLANKKGYARKDVRERLLTDFDGKCYLCENAITLGSMQVDHRKPRAAFPDEAFEWGNLFPTCEGCNVTRPTTYSDGSSRQYPTAADLLDPTKSADDPERRVLQSYDATKGEPVSQFVFVEAASGDRSARFTAEELRYLHTAPTVKAEDLRRAISRQVQAFYRAYVRLSEAERDPATPPGELNLLREQLRLLVSRRAPFTMLVRSIVPPRLHALFD